MKPWFSPAAQDKAQALPGGWQPMRVVAQGMCCAVGHTAAAACAAMRARMNHFRETQFVDGGEPVIGAPLYQVDVWGAQRLQWMLSAALSQVFAAQPDLDAAQVAVLLLTPEPGRAGMPLVHMVEQVRPLLADLAGKGRAFHPRSAVCPYGKGGIAHALSQAAALLAEPNGPAWVLLAAADSLLDAAVIEQLRIDERLATPSNQDGLIPGEGAAAVLLAGAARGASAQPPALWIDSAAGTEETWRLGADEPIRAQALTQALRNAAAQAHTALADLDFHASGMTGESWYAKEANLALARAMEHKKTTFAHLIAAASLGETGAAAPVLTLAWLADLMGREWGSPGRSAMLHFAGDDGQRSAVVVRHRSGVPARA
jgi:3-oxoacyl-[acyl-carrier-protein] synthase I